MLSVVGVAAAIALGLPGCGGASTAAGGGTLTGTYFSFPDYLDPALSYSIEGWTAMQNAYIPLLTYAHADGMAGTRLIPGLADTLPKISDGGRRYTLFMRPGLRYSDGTAVRASDFPYALERVFKTNSSAAPLYEDIVGTERFARTKSGGISGIKTNDRTGEIAIVLKQPRGTFSYELALLFAAPVPPDTPDTDQTAHPPPATGPYVITKSDPSRGCEYERNPVWASTNSKAMPDLPGGHVSRIKMTVVTNSSTQVNEVEQGSSDWMKNPPPPDRYAEVKRRYEGTQFREEPTISLYYFWMNTSKPPFDDVRVRRAVNYALNPAALERIYGGTVTPTQQVLPPGMPGHRPFVLYPHNLAKAKRLIAEADPKDRDLTVWSDSATPNDQAAEYYENVLTRLGFHTSLKLISPTDYFTVIGDLSTPNLDTGYGNWLLDYPHPNDYFEPQLSAQSIQPTNNTNWAQFDDPALNAKIEELGREQLGPRQQTEYAALDRATMRQAPWAPFGNLTVSTFVSSAVDLEKVIVSPIFGQDLTSFQLK